MHDPLFLGHKNDRSGLFGGSHEPLAFGPGSLTRAAVMDIALDRRAVVNEIHVADKLHVDWLPAARTREAACCFHIFQAEMKGGRRQPAIAVQRPAGLLTTR